MEKGLFLKVDSSHHIQLGTVYRGRQRLTDQEVNQLYSRRQLSVTSLEPNLSPSRLHNAQMVQLVDIFSKPEMALMAGVMDHFMRNRLEIQPESLHFDVSTCIGESDSSGTINTL